MLAAHRWRGNIVTGVDPPGDAAAEFIGKWRSRWPEWQAAMAFVPAADRTLVAAWFTLLQELCDAAWGGADATPGLAKLAWWQQELDGWSKGARRHPLGIALKARPAPWRDLALGLPSLQASRPRPGEAAPADALAGFAAAVAACEVALFGTDGPGARHGGDAGQAVARALLSERALQHPADADQAPDARHGRAGDGVVAVATRPRRIHDALVRARLRNGGRPPSAGRVLLAAWRAARGR